MLDSFREKTAVVITQSVAGLALPEYDLPTAFSFLPGDRANLHPTLAKAWIASGVCRRAAEVTIEELIDLKFLAAR